MFRDVNCTFQTLWEQNQINSQDSYCDVDRPESLGRFNTTTRPRAIPLQ